EQTIGVRELQALERARRRLSQWRRCFTCGSGFTWASLSETRILAVGRLRLSEKSVPLLDILGLPRLASNLFRGDRRGHNVLPQSLICRMPEQILRTPSAKLDARHMPRLDPARAAIHFAARQVCEWVARLLNRREARVQVGERATVHTAADFAHVEEP